MAVFLVFCQISCRIKIILKILSFFFLNQQWKMILIKLLVLQDEVWRKYTVDEINKTNNFYW